MLLLGHKGVKDGSPKSPVLAALTIASTWTNVMSPLLLAKNAQHDQLPSFIQYTVYRGGKEAQLVAVDPV